MTRTLPDVVARLVARLVCLVCLTFGIWPACKRPHREPWRGGWGGALRRRGRQRGQRHRRGGRRRRDGRSAVRRRRVDAPLAPTRGRCRRRSAGGDMRPATDVSRQDVLDSGLPSKACSPSTGARTSGCRPPRRATRRTERTRGSPEHDIVVLPSRLLVHTRNMMRAAGRLHGRGTAPDGNDHFRRDRSRPASAPVRASARGASSVGGAGSAGFVDDAEARGATAFGNGSRPGHAPVHQRRSTASTSTSRWVRRVTRRSRAAR
jgi:hypothetical protein